MHLFCGSCRKKMDAETSSMLTVESAAELVAGTETVMIRIEGTELYLMGDGERISVVRTGEFALRVVKQAQSSLLAAFCTVGDHQWPVGVDSPVLRVGLRRFSFALPGFVYGLTLPESCSDEQLKRLEETLMRFSTYETHSDQEEKQGSQL